MGVCHPNREVLVEELVAAVEALMPWAAKAVADGSARREAGLDGPVGLQWGERALRLAEAALADATSAEA